MNFDEMIDVVGRRLGNRTDLDTWILSEMKLAQDALEDGDVIPWFLQTTADVTITNGTEYGTGPLPTGFIQEIEEEGFWLKDFTTTLRVYELIKAEPKILIQSTIDNELPNNNTPGFYALGEGAILTYPISTNATETIDVHFYAKDTTVPANDATTNAWATNAAELLIAETGMRIAPYLDNKAALASFNSSRNEAMGRLVKTHEMKQAANQSMSMRAY